MFLQPTQFLIEFLSSQYASVLMSVYICLPVIRKKDFMVFL